jgi:hypothetical protein
MSYSTTPSGQRSVDTRAAIEFRLALSIRDINPAKATAADLERVPIPHCMLGLTTEELLMVARGQNVLPPRETSFLQPPPRQEAPDERLETARRARLLENGWGMSATLNGDTPRPFEDYLNLGLVNVLVRGAARAPLEKVVSLARELLQQLRADGDRLDYPRLTADQEARFIYSLAVTLVEISQLLEVPIPPVIFNENPRVTAALTAPKDELGKPNPDTRIDFSLEALHESIIKDLDSAFPDKRRAARNLIRNAGAHEMLHQLQAFRYPKVWAENAAVQRTPAYDRDPGEVSARNFGTIYATLPWHEDEAPQAIHDLVRGQA